MPGVAMKVTKDLQTLFKKGHVEWTDSGNGKMAEGRGGDTMQFLVKITRYDKGNIEEEAEGELVIQYCDDDRFKVCDSNLGTT